MRKLSKPFIRKEQGSWGQKDGAGGGRESQQLESLGSDTAEQVEGSLQGRLEVSLAFPVLSFSMSGLRRSGARWPREEVKRYMRKIPGRPKELGKLKASRKFVLYPFLKNDASKNNNEDNS